MARTHTTKKRTRPKRKARGSARAKKPRPKLGTAKRIVSKKQHSAVPKRVIRKRTRAALKRKRASKKPAPSLEKFHGNPIIEPNAKRHWESKATFNPGAVYEDGKVHMLYRAIGDNDVSVLGYASSRDGVHIDERGEEPAYVPPEIAMPDTRDEEPMSTVYASGGGWWGGAEDPRLTVLDNRVYLLYVSYDGWSPPRVALTSITKENFLKKAWRWRKPKLISQPPEMLRTNPRFKDVVDKNASLFPEKINGKYAILHRIFPDILIDFVDSLDFKNTYLAGQHKISPRPHFWDSRKVGAGAPPIRTKEGWLLIYQAVGDADPSRYKIGAMLLDLKDPTKVLHRSREPILEPDTWYENEGYKYGVVYPCGAVVIDGTLFVYYGGADSVVCVATAPLKKFVKELKRTQSPRLTGFESSSHRRNA